MKKTAIHVDNKTDPVSVMARQRSGFRGSKVSVGLLGAEYKPRARNALSGRFVCPPFSVLNAREGWWQERKRAWIGLGIRSELGRGENLLKFSDSVMAAQQGQPWGRGPGDARKPAIAERWQVTKARVDAQNAKRGLGAIPTNQSATIDRFNAWCKSTNYGKSPNPPRGLTWRVTDMDEMRHREASQQIDKAGNFRTVGRSVYLLPPDENDESVLTGTSIFDPVLCEIVYRWFCFEGGHVLDPFAGGSVRGIVAGELGLQYTGVDLSERQVAANFKQAEDIGTKPTPHWICGDSRNIRELVTAQHYDFIWTCPPYGHLEQYSNDQRDISTMSPEAFSEAYSQIIHESCTLLRQNRFAAIVVGDYRSKDGFYLSLPAQTIVAFEEAGLQLYNQIVLITAIGSLPMRINAQFVGSRKLGNTHQHVLIFAKGQPRDFVKTWSGNMLNKEVT